MPDRRFRFGVQAAWAESAAAWRDTARSVESAGYAQLAVTDHLTKQLGPITALMAAADATTGLEVGTTVFANDFRHPAVLAKEIATLDLLSEGRLFVGLGAGWLKTEYDAAGLELDPAGRRIERMAESLTVLRGLLAGGPFSFQGAHYRISGMEGSPLPHQKPHPPILIGGGGRRILSLAAREADIVGINVDLRGGTFQAMAKAAAGSGRAEEKVAWVREAAGERFDRLELNVCVFNLIITDDREGAAAILARERGVDPEQVLATPNVLIGSIDQLADTLERRREQLAISNVMIPLSKHLDFAPVVERLAGR